MAVIWGPSIITENLILYLDKYNEESYLGEATTNLTYTLPYYGSNPNYLVEVWNWNNSGTATLETNATDIPKPNGYKNSDMRIVRCECLTVGSQHRGPGITNIPDGAATYSLSVYYRQNRAGVGAPYMRGITQNTNLGYLSYGGSTSTGSWPRNEWIRIEGTCTTASNETALTISNYIGIYVGDTVWYFMPQVELKGHSSKGVAGSRSTNDGWRDLSGNDNHANFDSVTFSSTDISGSTTGMKNFDFNGSSDYMDIPDLGSGNVATIMAWIKSDTDHSGFVYTPHANGHDNWFGVLNQKIYFFGTQSADTNNFSLYGTTVMSNGSWNQIAMTINYATSTVQVWLNGSLENSTTRSHTIADWGAAASLGRRGTISQYYFNGEIASVMVYSEVLTAAEILKNFNAHKGRYGL